MASTRSRKRVGPNLYLRGDGKYVAGLSIAGRWTMQTLSARTKREATHELAKLRVDSATKTAAETTRITFADLAAEFIGRFEDRVNSGERSVHA
jgi:hypothetical protein